MPPTMTSEEREVFLAEVHVAILAVAGEDGRAPLTVPIWYEYRPGGEVAIVTDRDSRKTELIRRAGRVSLCVQDERPPYRYASVEGPVTAIDDDVTDEQRRSVAARYLGAEGADAFIASTAEVTGSSVRIVVRPEHWLTRAAPAAGT